MNWVFLDVVKWDYDVTAPLSRPFGGSQSAMCYLATALARQGQQVTVLNGIKEPRIANGVRCIHFESIPADVFSPADTVFVVLNAPADFGRDVRKVIPSGPPVIL